jgi:hypothetical protein
MKISIQVALSSMRTTPHDSTFDLPQRPQDQTVCGRSNLRPLPSPKQIFGKEKVQKRSSFVPPINHLRQPGKPKVKFYDSPLDQEDLQSQRCSGGLATAAISALLSCGLWSRCPAVQRFPKFHFRFLLVPFGSLGFPPSRIHSRASVWSAVSSAPLFHVRLPASFRVAHSALRVQSVSRRAPKRDDKIRQNTTCPPTRWQRK